MITDMKEKLSLIEEVGRLLCRNHKRRKPRYIKECKEEFLDDQEFDDEAVEWEGRINSIKRSIGNHATAVNK